MQPYITETWEEVIETESETGAKTVIDRRVANIEKTLINRNPTVDRILEACCRIQMRWNMPVQEVENG